MFVFFGNNVVIGCMYNCILFFNFNLNIFSVSVVLFVVSFASSVSASSTMNVRYA